jgi:FkbM family methyltransferase
MDYLLAAFNSKDEIYALLRNIPVEVFVDVGAYNGDTAKEALQYFNNLKKIYAIEPDKRNFKRLAKFFDGVSVDRELIFAAAYSECSGGFFSGSGNRNSTLSATASYEHRCDTVSLVSIDSIVKEKIDYIKYDVEGEELSALIGSEKTILKDSPALLVSLYHRSCDIFSLPIYLSKYKGYTFYLRRLCCLPAWELMLIMIPTPLENL